MTPAKQEKIAKSQVRGKLTEAEIFVSEGQIIREAWDDYEHQERKKDLRCRVMLEACGYGGEPPARYCGCPATDICTGGLKYPVCSSHKMIALIAGWNPVDLDSAAGRNALDAFTPTPSDSPAPVRK